MKRPASAAKAALRCAREDRGTEYVLRCGDGEGRTVCYEVFPGMELCRHRYQAHACRETREEGGLLELNFCVSGRFECAFTPRECVVLGPGDLSAHWFDGLHGADSYAEFPLGYYEGVSLLVDCGPPLFCAQKSRGQTAPAGCIAFS